MKKRTCIRFNIPGTTIHYKQKKNFFAKNKYSDSYYPVLNISKGGTNFLCDRKLKTGRTILLKLNIPGVKESPEILANIRWISKNPEKSYKYQAGAAFHSYGTGKKQNSPEILELLKRLENQYNGKD